VHMYCDASASKFADFLFISDHLVNFNEIKSLATGDSEEDLSVLVTKVYETNHQILICDLTTPDVEELGFSVVRAIIPGFHPLFMGHGNRALGGSRLWEIPQKLGYKGIIREAGDNPAPHPYP